MPVLSPSAASLCARSLYAGSVYPVRRLCVRLRSGRPRYKGRNPEGAATPTVSARHRCSAHQAGGIGPSVSAFPLVRPPHPAGIVQSSGPPDLTRPGIYSAEQAQEEPRRDWIMRHRGATVPRRGATKNGLWLERTMRAGRAFGACGFSRWGFEARRPWTCTLQPAEVCSRAPALSGSPVFKHSRGRPSSGVRLAL